MRFVTITLEVTEKEAHALADALEAGRDDDGEMPDDDTLEDPSQAPYDVADAIRSAIDAARTDENPSCMWLSLAAASKVEV